MFSHIPKLICTPFLALALLFTSSLAAQTLLLMDESALSEVKQRVQSGQLNEAQKETLKSFLKKADKLIKAENPSVMDKTLLPPTKDKHDYLSISRYWWPDPAKEDGLPWIRKDGVTNPDTQTEAVDRPRLSRMVKGVKQLSLAYYLTGEKHYAEKASAMVRTWFLDEKSKMNPHLSFAQSVPGYPKSRRSGILDGRLIPQHVLDSLTLIAGSGAWSEVDQAQMEAWLRAYLNWLTQSKVGKQGAEQTNNHGSWYKFQVAALASYLGDKATLASIVEQTKQSFNDQFDVKGVQAHEVARTRSYFYSCFNLSAMLSVAMVAEKAGMPFWQHVTKDNKSLKLGIDYLIPVLEGQKWPHRAKKVLPKDMIMVLSLAKGRYPETKYDQHLEALLKAHADRKTVQRLLVRNPEFVL